MNPAPHSPIGSRYEGFQPNSHTGTAVAAMPDVNGDGYDELAIGMPDASLHRPGGGGAAVLYGKPSGEHINLADLWEAGYPYYFHIDYPTLDNQHIGETLASVPDMTGDGSPDLAVGAPQSDLNGKVDSGSVWIINGRLPPATGCRRPTVDATCPWIRIDRLSAAQGYRIDGAAAGDGLGSSLANVGDVNGDGRPDLAIGASSASPYGRSGAGEVVVMAGQAGSATSTAASALQRIAGPSAGAGLGASLASAGDVDGDGRTDLLAGAPGEAAYAGAAYFLRGAPGTASDLAQGALPLARRSGGSGRPDGQRRGHRPGQSARRRARGERRQRRRVPRHRQRLARRRHPLRRRHPPRRLRRHPRPRRRLRRSPSRRSSARSRSRSRSTGSSRASA